MNPDDRSSMTASTIAARTPTDNLTISVKFSKAKRGGHVRIIEPGTEPAEKSPEAPPPAPTIVRSLVRAHAYERLIRSGAATSYADVAALVKQTTARLSQIAMLLSLAPDLQAEILSLAAPERRGVSIDEKEVRRIANEADWEKQRTAWREIRLKTEAAIAPTAGVATGQ